jgi:hypothetical protein
MPTPDNSNQSIGNCYATCWVLGDDLEAAAVKAKAYLTRHHFAVVKTVRSYQCDLSAYPHLPLTGEMALGQVRPFDVLMTHGIQVDLDAGLDNRRNS